jgi:hypothetical protein
MSRVPRLLLASLLAVISSLACAAPPRAAESAAPFEPVAADLSIEVPAEPSADPAQPVAVAAPGPRADVGAMGYVAQTWNNCGPASVVMVLSYLGLDVSQEVARLALRGPDVSRGMPAQNVAPWVGEQFGLKAVVRTNGSRELVRTLVANGFPVIVTQWLYDPPSRIAHYRVVRGYDEATQRFLVNDPIRGAGVHLDYGWFDANWQVFLYRYLVIYRPADEPTVRAIVGDDWNDTVMRTRMYARAQAESAADSHDAWLALGEAAYQIGRYDEAVAAFEKGLALGGGAGVFTMRSSYPNALRALGREAEADAARARLSPSR